MDSSISSLQSDSLSQSFRFLDLPSELRNRIYELLLKTGITIELDPKNYRRIARRLDLFQTSRQIHEESYPIFYGGHTFRLFSTNGKFFNTKRQLLARLPPRYRASITNLELRLGPGWSAPPRSWAVTHSLGLIDATALRVLKVFVECDPSDDIFRGFRIDDGFYTGFCGHLLKVILHDVPSLQEIRFSGYPYVLQEGPLMQRLLKEVNDANKRLIMNVTEKHLTID
ncbi:MAG: hypothetical protein M1827_003759 [Pycnora praestabilis]|nr:MAG: hypothetical protein M1827_003759 [Pycnora praestabilis]